MREFVKLKESFQFSFLSGLLKQQSDKKVIKMIWNGVDDVRF